MDRKKQIDTLKKLIRQLRKTRDDIRRLEDSVLDLENQVNLIDGNLPEADALRGEERAQVLHLYDLAREAFDLIDEILGPPDDDVTGAPAGTAYMPEARGNGEGLSLEDILSDIAKSSGRHAS